MESSNLRRDTAWAMSEENWEVPDQAVEAFRRRDRTAFLAVHDQNFEVVPNGDWPKPGARGPEAAWDFFLKTFGAFESVVIVGSVDAEGGKVLLHYQVTLSGRGIGAGIKSDYWNLATIRQGKFLRAHWFADHAEALEAAGLRE